MVSLARSSRVGNLVAFGIGAGASWLAYRVLCARPPGGGGRWDRVNHRGEPVTLLEGPAVAAGLAASALLAPGLPARLRGAAVLAALGSGGFGVLDDLGETGSSKGLRGHLGALLRGEVTTGGLKVLGIGATGLAVAALAGGGASDGGAGGGGAGSGGAGGAPRGRLRAGADVVSSAGLVAGAANLLNLFDLRPGRALKVCLLHTPAALGAGPAGPVVALATGAAVGMLEEDLGERAMLGDAGANALGAVLGLAAAAGTRPRTRWGILAGIVGLTLASERISFTKVIAATPGLREFDALGRRPAVR